MTAKLEVKNISKSFENIEALTDVSFAIEPGEIMGFVGANGAGKTTTMRIIMGVLAGDNGEVLVDGRPINQDDRGHIGYMPSERGMYPKMKVGEQLVYLAELHGLTKNDAREEVAKWLRELNIEQYADSVLKTLSTGNAQRVQLASALVSRPDILILDEPFSGLDPIAVANMSDTIAKMAKSGIAVLFSSHQLELIDELCDKVVIIQGGRIVQNGSPQELREEAHVPQTIEVPTPLSHIFKELLAPTEVTENV
ncbi:MAG: ATP-binding cassette domain-containing protein [Lactobacillales bacterium]|nr:ATP-binding cassette domain-containing protein [Lactobacillales bacterium]